jgi:hypothetical protein
MDRALRGAIDPRRSGESHEKGSSNVKSNPILDRLWKLGYEEIIGPLGPYAALLRQERQDPIPDPWRIAVARLVEAAQAKEIAAELPPASARQKEEMEKSASESIEVIFDEYCGTPPHPRPWPWPGPPPWTWQIVSGLSLVANTLQAGALRDGILDIAVQLTMRASAVSAKEVPAHEAEVGQAAHA